MPSYRILWPRKAEHRGKKWQRLGHGNSTNLLANNTMLMSVVMLQMTRSHDCPSLSQHVETGCQVKSQIPRCGLWLMGRPKPNLVASACQRPSSRVDGKSNLFPKKEVTWV